MAYIIYGHIKGFGLFQEKGLHVLITDTPHVLYPSRYFDVYFMTNIIVWGIIN
jgi:hypothetical protein